MRNRLDLIRFATQQEVMQTLIRVPEVFADFSAEILALLGEPQAKVLGKDFFLLKSEVKIDRLKSTLAPYLAWHILVQHAWPCHPPDVIDFPEKAVQAMVRKFSAMKPQSVLFGSLTAAGPEERYRNLAKLMRARAVQSFAPHGATTADEQDPQRDTLFALVGKQGLYAGICSPREANGFHPGGRVFLKQTDVISRAGCKVVEALLRLRLLGIAPKQGGHWFELGASPGGMTAELLERGFRVTAVDRAPLDARLSAHPMLDFQLADAASYPVPSGMTYDGILCDMNGPCDISFSAVLRQVWALRAGGLVIFTLKGYGADAMSDWIAREQEIQQRAARHGLKIIDRVHLTHNRREFTLIWKKS